ncbi:MAG: SPFH domain-containing protein [Phycisphaerae bacterium]|jgi:membrane protease subunit HflC|nr:SPFH domain-containing protein [Phycisphaerae bacterium]
MKNKTSLIILAVAVLLILAAGTTCFTVESTELVLVQTLGRTSRILDGADGDAGLHFRWIFPIDKLVRYDNRIDMFEDVHKELQTSDKQKVQITMYCAWRVKKPETFLKEIKTIEVARGRIRKRLQAKQGDIIPKHPMRELVNTDPDEMKLAKIEEEVIGELREIENELGVEILTVGIKALGLAQDTSKAVIDAMKEERQKEITKLESMGQATADTIRSRAENASKQIVAFAGRKADEIRTAGHREAAKYYSQYKEQPRFGMFLRYLDTLQSGLGQNATIWLDGTKIPGVQFLWKGPSLPEGPVVPTPGKPQTKAKNKPSTQSAGK